MADDREIDRFLFLMGKTEASDLHFKVGSPPILRISRGIRRIQGQALSGEKIQSLVTAIMPEKARRDFERTGNVDFAYSVPGIGRFRVNVFRQRGSVSVAVRRVKYDIPSLDSLNLPQGVKRLCTFEQGLCIVAGPTGSGKSTTLAALLDHVNHTRACHIITIEDPIEYLYRDDMAFVNQREVGIDVESFQTGLKHALREDPDVILIGELRDPDTFETALQAAETGHLVFGTIHASSAAGSIGRILDLFPEETHAQIRQLLTFNLKAVIVQMLLPGITSHAGVVPAVEVMIVNPGIRKLIAEAQDGKIPDVVRGSRQEGMQDMTQSLHDLVRRKLVDQRMALQAAPNPEALRMALKGIVVHGSEGGILSR